MTSFSTQAIAGPVIGTMVSNDKGDLSNRAKCAGAHLKNNATTAAQAVLLTGACGAAGAVGYRHSTPIARFVDKGVDTIIKKGKLDYTPIKQFAQRIKSLPPKAKVLAAIGLPFVIGLSYIRDKYLYQAGQIDQKYTDMAKIKEDKEKVFV